MATPRSAGVFLVGSKKVPRYLDGPLANSDRVAVLSKSFEGVRLVGARDDDAPRVHRILGLGPEELAQDDASLVAHRGGFFESTLEPQALREIGLDAGEACARFGRLVERGLEDVLEMRPRGAVAS